MKSKDILIVLFATNLPTLGLLFLTGWFAYLDNGYWGWPFAFALMSMSVLKSSQDKFEEQKKEAIEREELRRKYGKDLFNTAHKN